MDCCEIQQKAKMLFFRADIEIFDGGLTISVAFETEQTLHNLSMSMRATMRTRACCSDAEVRHVGGTYLQGVCEAEWDNLRHTQLLALVKDDVVVNVHHAAGVLVKQNVVQMAVPQAKKVPNLQKKRPSEVDWDRYELLIAHSLTSTSAASMISTAGSYLSTSMRTMQQTK